MADSYEIDFHPVGEGARSGEAISGKFTIGGYSQIIVIDGGTAKSGEEVSERLAGYYGSSRIDQLVLTHADDDHSSGLREIMDRCDVRALWINRPWLYAADLVGRFKGNWTADGLEKELRKSFPIVNELEEKALAAGIPIYAPLEGALIGPFTVVSPSLEFYLDLLPQMSRTPEPAAVKVEGILEKGFRIVLEAAQAAKQAVFSVFESWDIETLGDNGETSASNESSVVLHGTVDGQHILMTGDAGQQALVRTADYCDHNGLSLRGFKLVSIPHHGSRRNVGPSILNRVVGDKVPQNEAGRFSAIVSAAKDDEDHPRRVVMNAFKRRGASTAKTEGQVINTRHNVESRAGWTSLPDIPIYSQVEE